MNLFNSLTSAIFPRQQPRREPLGPPEKPLRPDNLPHYTHTRRPGIVDANSVLPHPSNQVHVIDFAALACVSMNQHMHPRPVHMFDRHDFTLTGIDPIFFRPEREIQHV